MKTIHAHVWIITAIAFTLVFSLCCGGLCATFNYCQGGVGEQITAPETSLVEFNYLVSGFPNTVEGQMNQQLVMNAIKAIDTPNSKTNAAIEGKANEGFGWLGNHDTLGNQDYHYGKDLSSELFDETTGQDMTVLIYFPNGPESNYIIFTTTTPIVKSDSNTWFGGIYKTVLDRNPDGTYTAEPTQVGWAKYTTYKQKFTGDLFLSTPSFDPMTWTDVDPTQA